VIPTVILVGFIVGVLPRMTWRTKAIIGVGVAVAWAVLIAVTLDASAASVAGAFGLGLANAAVGVLLGLGLLAATRRITGAPSGRAAH